VRVLRRVLSVLRTDPEAEAVGKFESTGES
jgi:hypothetical protein